MEQINVVSAVLVTFYHCSKGSTVAKVNCLLQKAQYK